MSCIVNRYSKANNKYMKNYNKKVESKYIAYLDANNPYGWAICKPLPTGGHRWLSDEEINGLHDRITTTQGLPPDGDKGWVLEVDLEYPDTTTPTE